jgi:hypothetical protein
MRMSLERPTTGAWIRTPKPSRTTARGACRSEVVRNSYRSIQVNVGPWGCNIVGDAANEPSIAVDLTDPRKMVIGWRQFNSVSSDFREPGWAYSHDGGHTWVFRGSLDPGVFGSDPVLAAAPDGHARVLCDRVDIGLYEFGIGDFDCDQSADLSDFSAWEQCMTGPTDGGPADPPYATGCEAFDLMPTPTWTFSTSPRSRRHSAGDSILHN